MLEVTLIFNYFKQGWSETWFASGSPGVDTWLTVLNSVCDQRAAFLAADCTIEAARVIDLSNAYPNSRYAAIGDNGKPGAQAAVNKINDSLCYRAFSSGASSKRNFGLRGLPDGWISNGKLTSAGQSGKSSLVDPYVEFLKSLGVGFRWTSVARTSRKSLFAFTYDTTVNLMKVRCGAGVEPAKNDRIKLGGCKSAPQFNAIWTVADVGTQEFWLAGSADFNFQGSASRMFWYKITPAFVSWDSIYFERVFTQKTGKAFFVVRGRQSPRIRRT